VIHFSLCCDQHHRFDGWFRSNEDFEKQCQTGLVACPVCDSVRVEKALMTPALGRTSKKESAPDLIADGQQALWQQVQEMARQIREQADYVGKDFAEQARKIHFGEVEPRAIYGEAQRAEVVSLLEDGVDIMPLPPLPEKQN